MASPATSTLDQIAVTALKGVGPKLAEKLAGLGLFTLQDILFHLPLRYQDRTRITPIGALRNGDDVVVEAEVKAADVVFGRRRSLLVRVQDGTGTLSLRFFHFSTAQRQGLNNGTRIRCFGEVRRGASGLELYHPEYQQLGAHAPALEETLTPIYPTTEGLSQVSWRKLTEQALSRLKPEALREWLPPQSATASLVEALHYLHRPPPGAALEQLQQGLHPLQQRLAFEELLAHQLSMQKLRHSRLLEGAPAMPAAADLQQRLLQQLGFELTAAQQRVVAEIAQDMAQPRAMLRLVQGDVGSGKTVVAALAALQAIASGYQVALMAPTEILAEQHYRNFCEWFFALQIPIGWLTGKVKGKARREQLEAMREHQVQLVVGTHALFQEEVDYARLGLVIIDEQHRFGVHQRLALKEKARPESGQPHQLVMTATPIPRTLAMSAYADLDTSVIDELPPGRTPVNTLVIDNNRRPEVIERVRSACSEGRQAYWVCTLIEESEQLQAQAAEDTAQLLSEALNGLRVGLIHGRMKADEKALVMECFEAQQLDLLVATTVIEVGVNVPNASLMIIENAERLGLSQLHQLRGRVGRGATASHCLLMYQAPLGRLGKERLQTLRDSNDGFVIAERDLELRGPGELLGTRQTGLQQLRIADLQRDGHLLDAVKQTAQQLLQNYPDHCDPLIRRWLSQGEKYAQV